MTWCAARRSRPAAHVEYRGQWPAASGWPVDQRHAYLGDLTVADALLDRLVHNSYRLVLKGEFVRRNMSLNQTMATPSRAIGR
jgi:hypothetical protein